MKKQIISKILIVAALTAIAAPAFANPTADAAAHQFAHKLSEAIKRVGVQYPLASFIVNSQKTAVAISLIGSALLGGTAACAVNKLANYFNSNKNNGSYRRAFTCGAIGGALTVLATIPMGGVLLDYGMIIGAIRERLTTQAEQLHFN